MTLSPIRGQMTCLALCLLVWLTGLSEAGAAELYRWVEPDGSITFSPTPPAAGIDFEQVSTEGDAASTLEPMDSSMAADEPAALDPASDPAALASGADTAPDSALDTALDRPGTGVDGLSYAPPPLGAAIDDIEGIGASDVPDDVTGQSADPAQAPAANGESAALQTRRARCRELEKRVISLERRLGTNLSPEDMDNTVLYMARYQQNVDRHCKR